MPFAVLFADSKSDSIAMLEKQLIEQSNEITRQMDNNGEIIEELESNINADDLQEKVNSIEDASKAKVMVNL